MYEYKSDMETAVHALKEETEGVRDYKWMIENCQDAEVKAIAQKVLNDEKQHVILWTQWIAKNIQK